ncbi:acetyl-CoA carboxylase biotin carboxyl carrier protein subunit [Bacteroidia bacterium]|nr:acetyl-CoA carboxylase biotin carboxyl carrier protein subunit [Bacteroidia bacterium]GHU65607.1 acetyl-CoA carboxylase biotin carboxyl carrier protein subunit [Bacteroidia bacterium]GHU81575.1 acetyl-CoA carboxylase biotin carboxyl carrier protein subunit [Bacteroidia bacterium]GHV70641.1 acetyl-CoA carboxylase biotin carboxyl carrier protein subunit [Bacteroidia bacterium]
MKSFKYTINGNAYNVVIHNADDTTAEVEVNGTSYQVQIEAPVKKATAAPEKKAAPVVQRPAPEPVTPIAKPVQTTSASALKSPLPGIILDINAKVGDTVKKGQKVLVLEAMKMENAINADRDGEIKEIRVNKGDSVLEGTDLLVIG